MLREPFTVFFSCGGACVRARARGWGSRGRSGAARRVEETRVHLVDPAVPAQCGKPLPELDRFTEDLDDPEGPAVLQGTLDRHLRLLRVQLLKAARLAGDVDELDDTARAYG